MGVFQMVDFMEMFKARLWMKRNVPFLHSWHAYVGYELDLFLAFERGVSVTDVSDAYQLDITLLEQWVNVGVSIGHLKSMNRERYKTIGLWKLPRPKEESSSGVILKEIMELHIPSLLNYPEMMREKKRNHFDADRHADTVAETSRLLEIMAIPKIAKLLKEKKNQHVLDIGCGEGGYIQSLAETFEDSTFDGIEVSQSVAQTATELTEGMKNVTIEQSDLWKYEPKKTYNLLLMNNIIHYIPREKRQELFNRLSGWLNEDGVLSVITPISSGQDSPPFVAAFNSFFISFDNLYSLPREEELTEWARGAGLKIVSIQSVIREGGWVIVQYKKTSSEN